jgi:putative endopeptidase
VAPACLLFPSIAYGDALADYHGMNPGFIDRKINPTEDFFRFSNGLWLDRTQIPQDQQDISASAQARQRNEERLWNIVAAAAIDDNTILGSPEQIVGQFLRTGMDQELADRLRAKPLDDELHRIAAIQTRGDVMTELGRLHRWSISVGFETQVGFDYFDSTHKILHLWQGGLTLRGREEYLKDDSKTRNLKARVGRVIQKTLTLVGDDPAVAEKESRRIIAIESQLAQAWRTGAETNGVEENFHYCKPSQLTNSTANVDWPRYFEALGAGGTTVVNVAQPEFLKAFGDLLAHVSVRDWQSYLRWHLASACSPYLSSEFVEQRFELDSALTGQELIRSRREAVLEEMDRCLGAELGLLLARTDFTLGSKQKVLSMVQNIRVVLRKTIDGLDWMAPSTKSKALEKLDRMQIDVCYPDHFRDSSKMEIRGDSYLKNVIRAHEFEFQRKLDGLSKPVDRAEWDVRAYAVDAHYNPSLNAIILPAGVLQAPYFDIKADDASNYGSFGTVIGHEMMHAFDGRGRKFDADGNLKNWWTPSDGVRYDEHQKDFIAQYDRYPMLDTLKVNGKLTLEENIADLGGVIASYAAFQRSRPVGITPKVDGFTAEQRFFISFGQLFRAKSRPESERFCLEADPHSPPKFRVKGVLQNVPEFWKAFNAEPPKTQLRIW